MAENQQNQPPPASSAPPAPVESPEPDIDSLLANIPELKSVFGDQGESGIETKGTRFEGCQSGNRRR